MALEAPVEPQMALVQDQPVAPLMEVG